MHVIGSHGAEIALETAECHPDHISVMKLVPEPFLGQVQPELVEQFDVLWPQPGRMGPEVEEGLSAGGLIQDFERQPRPWSRESFPGITEGLCLLRSAHLSGQPHYN
jgi:hypothetical protein